MLLGTLVSPDALGSMQEAEPNGGMLMTGCPARQSPAALKHDSIRNLIMTLVFIVGVAAFVACSSSTPSGANSSQVLDSDEPWVKEYKRLHGDDYETPLAAYEDVLSGDLGIDWRSKLRATWEAEEREQESWLATRDADIEASRVIIETTVETKAAAIRGDTRAVRALAWDELIASLPDAELAAMRDDPSCRRMLDSVRHHIVERGYFGDVSSIIDPDDRAVCTQALNDYGDAE